MAELIEFTTSPYELEIFYKVTNGALIFYVKGHGKAAVGLAKKAGQKCDYWVFFGYNEQILIHDDRTVCCNVTVPNVLFEEKYQKYWISWYTGELRVGKNNKRRPILTLNLPVSYRYLQYATFTATDEIHTIHWKFYLPPQIEKPPLRKFECEDLHWVKFKDKLPDNAVIGGYEEGFLYVIRAYHNRSLTPGKYMSHLGSAFISWGGEMHEKKQFEVLCGFNYKWIKTKNCVVPVEAIKGGYSEDDHESLFIGRTLCNGHIIPGKVQTSYCCCMVPYDGDEVKNEVYETLIKPCSAIPNTNKFYINQLDPYRNPNTSGDEESDHEEENVNLYVY